MSIGSTISSDYERIAEAIRFLEAEYRSQPTLEEVAAHLALSPAHFQRLFRQWAGISPKRFVQYLTVDYAKAQLTASRSVLDASYAAGLTGPGRLHDLFVTVEAMTPGEYKQQGAGVPVVYGFQETPFGDALLAVTPRGICHLAFVDGGRRDLALAELYAAWPLATIQADPAGVRPFAEAIFPTDQGTGRRTVSLLLKGSNFQIKVWEALLRTPPGMLTTYGEIAARLGQPQAARPVGNAVGANMLAYIIPCHRVIRQSGILGNYRWGAVRKRAMLGWEAAHAHDMVSSAALR